MKNGGHRFQRIQPAVNHLDPSRLELLLKISSDRLLKDFKRRAPAGFLAVNREAIHKVLETEETESKVDRRGLSPQWIYEREGEFAQIRRWIFCHPFSREAVAYRRMRDSVLLYRLALGQARQDDLIRALSQQPVFRDSDPKDRRKLIRDLWTDLSPPRLRPRFVQAQ